MAIQDELLRMLAVPGAELDQALGVEPPQLQTQTEPGFQTTGFQRFLEGLSGLEGVGPAPTTFGEGLVSGLSRGLGSAGTKIAQERAKYEAASKQRQALRDVQNFQATRDYRSERARALRESSKAEREAKQKQADYERDNPLVTPEDAKANPGLNRLVGRRVPISFLKPEKTPAQIEAEAAAKARGEASVSGEGTVPTLTPAALDLTALNYAKTGQLPPGGMGKAGVAFRTKIINRAAEMDPNLDLASNRAGFESNKAALTQLRKIHTSAQAFEKTAIANANVLEGTLNKIADVGSPWINRPVRALARATGDPNIVAFRSALETVAPEFARLLNSPTASGQLSDTAREELRVILDPNSTVAQLKAALGILRQDAHNRTSNYGDQIAQIEKEIREGGRPQVKTPAGDKADFRFDPATGKIVPVGQ